jgi:HepT-like protein
MLLRAIWKRKQPPFKLVKKVISQVQFEMGQIDLLFDSYADLLERAEKSVPDLIEIIALASVLHSFSNGLENIFRAIAKEIDDDVPASAQWHRDLLNRMTETTDNRLPVLSAETSDRLSEYLGFRHFFRHSYSFFM